MGALTEPVVAQDSEPDECDAPAGPWRPYIFGEGEQT